MLARHRSLYSGGNFSCCLVMRDAFMTTSLYIDIMKISVSNIVYTGALDETTMSQLEFYEAAP